ncbi:NgoMIV family type II restriction endonuclease [Micromonospora sp. CP22]|uniref:NgoMIV family type II restriction endonuclease n=1 Tax=Micromonospora sp. CP22 TaxID=2580517 RepID=UPI0012BD77C9|nr:NgoMIV family type II restriction endonuclease [Micromonospora sp. CP22]MTK05415.1 restriction endonuclease [Micromonospora sp. CP22]
MTALNFVDELLGWRTLEQRTVQRLGRPYAPNCADADNCDIADYIYASHRVGRILRPGQTMGASFEALLLDHLFGEISRLDPNRKWLARPGRVISDFAQYAHLGVLEEQIKANVVLRTEFGREYAIKPDIAIGVEVAAAQPLLHAVVSVKWSMRSDRVQNVRPEGALLLRHRRGRAPHFVVVTAEPLPSRIAAIAMTTGEVDAVYHVMFDEMAEAVRQVGTREQKERWFELVTQGRVRDYAALPVTLTST